MRTHEERKAYYRDYQKKRYAEKKAQTQTESAGMDLEKLQRYNAAVEKHGLKGQKFWRQRRKLKIEIFGRSIFPEDAIRVKLYKRVKQTAAARKIQIDLQEDDVAIPEVCPILNIKLSYAIGVGGSDQASIDRIDSTKGYTADNIQTVSLRANILKRDATLEELVALGEWAKKILGENGER